jgi:hypothetical protein
VFKLKYFKLELCIFDENTRSDASDATPLQMLYTEKKQETGTPLVRFTDQDQKLEWISKEQIQVKQITKTTKQSFIF